MRRVLIVLLFFISGFTGLLYEIIWIRIFGLIFGNTTLAISTVLSAFMLGLAWGSNQLGKFADRFKNHLKAYALLELGVGLTALLIPLSWGILETLYTILFSLLNHQNFIFNLIKFALSFLVMLPATFLMGGTLPVVSHLLVEEKEKLGRGIGILYGFNTIGAVAGTFFTGFYLIRMLGVNQTLLFAFLLNIIIASIAFLYSSISPIKVAMEREEPTLPLLYFKQPHIRVILVIMALSGFTALAYEVIWTRLLVFLLTNSVYAFSIMLTTFLLGLALGSFWGGKLADRIKNLTALLGWIEIGVGVTALAVAFLFTYLPTLHLLIVEVHPGTSWSYWNGIRFLEAFVVMFLPTLLLGISFPVAVKIVVPQISRLGTGVGRVYFFNTLGSVFGSFLTGFVFIVFFGTAITTFIMIAINLTIGIYLLLYNKTFFNFSRNVGYIVLSLLIIAVIVKVAPPDFYKRIFTTVEAEYPLMAFQEGLEGTVTIHQNKSPIFPHRRIDVDGLNVAGTSFMLRTLQLLQGHLPFMIKPEASQVMQIGFGTGQTSAAALKHQAVNFELVEISPDVLQLANTYFQDVNQGVLGNHRFTYTIMDGKNFVKYTPKRYHIIMNDANYAVATPSASLFTQDHFTNCLEKLYPGGLLSTWMTTDLDPEDFRIVLKTFQTVFPYTLMWMAPNCVNKQVVLMGSVTPIKLDFQHLKHAMNNSAIQNDLKTVNLSSAYDLLACLLLDDKGIAEIAAQVPINTDNRPILEFSTKDVRSRDWCAYQNLAEILLHPPNLKKLIINLPEDSTERVKVEQNIQRYYASARQLFLGMMQFYQGNFDLSFQTLLEGSRQIPESNLAAEFFRSMDMTLAQLSLDLQKDSDNLEKQLRFIRYKIAQSQIDAARPSLKKLMKKYPEQGILYYELGRCYLATSQSDSAKMAFQKSVQLHPQISGSWYFLGKLLRLEGQTVEAVRPLEQAIALDPRMYEAYNELGRIHMIHGRYGEAERAFGRSIEILAFQPEINLDLAKCLIHLQRYQESLEHAQKSLSVGYEKAETFFTLGNAYYFLGNIPAAIQAFIKATQMDSTNADYYYNLGNSFILQRKFENAIWAFNRALALNSDYPDYYNNLALSYQELGNLKSARELLTAGLKKHPTSKLLQENLERLKNLENN